MDKEINFYDKESAKAKDKIESILGHKIYDLDFQIALAKKLNLNDKKCHLVFETRLNSEEMINLLQGFPWPELLNIIEIQEPIIPRNILSRIDEEIIKHDNEIWYIYKNDADPFPSNPHAHNYKTDLKLHLGTGELYKKIEL